MTGLRCSLLTLSLAAGLSGCAGMANWSEQSAEERAYSLPPSPPRPSETLPQRPVGPRDHLVKKGDTVYSIAFRNQLDYRELARWNNIGSDYLIYTGQVLRLTPPGDLPASGTKLASQGVDLNETGRPQALSTRPTPIVGAAMPAPTSVTAPAQPFPAPAAGAWRWPTQGTVARTFNPDAGSRGIDLTGNVGQPVIAAAGGKVVYSGSALKGYGELVIIKHDELHLSAYGYNRRRLVNDGDVVTAGQQIAELGMGPENKPILHFEIRERGRPIDPAKLLPGR
jgi:lipoprotein NlpD